MEVNPRPTMVFCKAYCEVLEDGDYINTCLQVNQGIRPKDLSFDGKSLGCFYFYCNISGNIDDIVNVDLVESLPNVFLKGCKRGDYIRPAGDAGVVIIAGALVGSSREELIREHKSLYDRLLKVDPMGRSY